MESACFEAAIKLIDAANSEDERLEDYQGKSWPREFLYSRRMSEVLNSFFPAASEALKIAARAQHIRRWKIAREDYPMDRVGYLRWRADLKNFHASEIRSVLEQAGYEPSFIERVRQLIKKENLKSDAEAQTLEDVACLVFLKDYFARFAQGKETEKLTGILQKTWHKMSPAGRQAALAVPLDEASRQLVVGAIGKLKESAGEA